MKNKTRWVVVGLVLIIALYVGLTYNSLVRAGNSADVQWAQVETVYQRRFDLIPNLVASVKGVFVQEQTIFGEIAEARTRYAAAVSNQAPVGERVAAANQVEGSLARLLVIMENYPALRSVETVQNLMVQLEGSENRISVERNRYNEIVGIYNLKTKTFPSLIVASIFGFEAKELFQAETGAEKAPPVDLAN